MAGEKKETTHSFYVILGIVAIVAVVGIVSILDNKKTQATDIVEDIDDAVFLTASLVGLKENCISLTDRPCYMRGAKAPTYWIEVGEAGAKNAYDKCLLNPVLTGEALVWTTVCGDGKKERVHFCYQGRGFAIYYLNGECVECKLPYCA